MSLYCRGKGQRRPECIVQECPKKDKCEYHKAFNEYLKYTKGQAVNEGFASGVWYIDVFECMDNDYKDLIVY